MPQDSQPRRIVCKYISAFGLPCNKSVGRRADLPRHFFWHGREERRLLDAGTFPSSRIPLSQMSVDQLTSLGIPEGNVDRAIRYIQSNSLSAAKRSRASGRGAAAGVPDPQYVLPLDSSVHSTPFI